MHWKWEKHLIKETYWKNKKNKTQFKKIFCFRNINYLLLTLKLIFITYINELTLSIILKW